MKKIEQVPGPKAIGVHGDSYIYAIFKTLGVIKMPLVDDGMNPESTEQEKDSKLETRIGD